ncbi:MAG: thioredoxin [Spirochaetaceae bacterium]|nr:thioredoxin [Spirochaetia bacterium]MCF7952345.1 thioredoxin [Spirochaetaceae bacterium]
MAGIDVTANNFEQEVLKSDVPVIVDFWAEWCVPCKMVHPILDEIASEYEGKIKVAKVNVDQEGDIASQYNIISIPTLLLFKDGTVVNQQVGAGPRQTIESFFKDYI